MSACSCGRTSTSSGACAGLDGTGCDDAQTCVCPPMDRAAVVDPFASADNSPLADPWPDDPDDSDGGKDKPPNQTTELIELARDRYRLIRSPDGRTYAVEHGGPNRAIRIGRKGKFDKQLTRAFYEKTGGAPSDAALNGAVKILDAYLDDIDPEPVYLRIAPHEDKVVVDLGAADGRCIVVSAAGWALRSKSPVIFRVTNATQPLPDPVSDGTGLRRLRALLNLGDGDQGEAQFRLVLGWLVAALIPGRPHVILYFEGQEGSAKTSAGRTLQRIVDPTGFDPGPIPGDERDFAVRLWGAHVHVFDNLSAVADWQSDALCRAATGSAFSTRELYSDDENTILPYLRPIVLTSIDAGAFKGDFADRLLPIGLHRIPDDKRRPERAPLGADAAKTPGVNDEFDAAHPYILGAILDLLVKVLATAKHVQGGPAPRMADFGIILKALDKAQDWRTFDDYRRLSKQIVGDVVQGDPFGAAILEFMRDRQEWTGTADELRQHTVKLLPDPEKPPRKWPVDGTRAGGKLRRMMSSLRVHGVEVIELPRENRRRPWLLRSVPDDDDITPKKSASPASPASPTHSDLRRCGDANDDAAGSPVSPTGPGDAAGSPVSPSASPSASPGRPAETTSGDAGDASSSMNYTGTRAVRTCAVCHQPMTVVEHGQTTHPTCDPLPPDDYPEDWPEDSAGAAVDPAARHQPRHQSRAQRHGRGSRQ